MLFRSPRVQNQYMRVVTEQGNLKAKNKIFEVFKVCNASWRGLGKIPQSGLKIKNEFSQFDVGKAFSIHNKRCAISDKLSRCRCGDILKGLIFPKACPLFLKACKPEHPIGPCMVSSEGACNAYYKYKK